MTNEEWKICPKCLDIRSVKEEVEECANGGTGMCDCEYMTTDENGEIVFQRIYHERVPLTRELLNRALQKIKDKTLKEKEKEIAERVIDAIEVEFLNAIFHQKSKVDLKEAFDEIKKKFLSDDDE